jgi:ribosome maturation factor RimP
MDLHDPVPTSYVLEVSSPGTERPLKKKEDFSRFKGENVKIKTAKQIGGSKNFTGILQEVREEGLLLETGKEVIEIFFEDISKANLCSKKGVGKR